MKNTFYTLLIWITATSLWAGVKVMDIEVTQAIQDLNNQVGLVSGKPTTVRVFAQSTSSNPVTFVKGTINAKLNGQPLSPANLRCFNLITAQPASSYDALNQRRQNASSLVCQLPIAWLNRMGDLNITATIESPAGDTASLSVSLPIRQDPGLKVELVPIRANCNGPCAESDGPTRSQMMATMRMVRDIYPTGDLQISIPKGWVALPANNDPYAMWAYLIQSKLLWGRTGQAFPAAGKDTIRMGVVPKNTTFYDAYGDVIHINGRGSDETRSGFVKLDSVDPTMTMAHEVGHTLGMDHVPDTWACSRGQSDCENYPYNGTQLSNGGARDPFGWNHSSGNLNPNDYGDIMSYQNKRWVSDFTYRKLYCLMTHIEKDHRQRRNACSGPVAGLSLEIPESERVLLITGTFNSQERVLTSLKTLVVPEPMIDIPNRMPSVNPLDPEGRLMLQLLDRDGSLLTAYPFNPKDGHFDGHEAPTASASISLILPFQAEVAFINLVDQWSGQELNWLEVSERAPVVERTVELPGTLWNDPLEVFWQAHDEDGETLDATLMLSTDGGESWEAVANGINAYEGMARLDTRFWPETSSGRLQLLVSDGVNTTVTDLGEFEVPNKAPMVWLEQVTEERPFENAPITLRALAFDAEDGALRGESLLWFSDLDGYLGEGTVIDSTGLSPGFHVIRVQGIDSSGQLSEDQMEVQIF